MGLVRTAEGLPSQPKEISEIINVSFMTPSFVG
jgi:hypothetical protein